LVTRLGHLARVVSLARAANMLLAGALLAGWASPARSATAPAEPPMPRRPVACAQLAEALEARRPEVQVQLTERVRHGPAAHPMHCRVVGRVAQRIGFELRLPEPWNGRFLHLADGGTGGTLRPAFGDLAVWDTDALSRGFAVLSTDSGHRADDPRHAAHGLARGVAFGLDPQARTDFAYRALDLLWPVAQAAIRLHYGRAPERQYLAGCGNGGRLGLQAASRWPDRYDGILAGAPALHWPRAALQHAWDWQQWQRVAPRPDAAFSPADLRLVADRILARCDGLDMLVDGQVQDIRRCQQAFRPADLQCRAAQTTGCLSAPQVQALQAVFAGPQDGDGQPLYTDWPFDPGIAAAGWRRWRIATDEAGWGRLSIGSTLGAAALAYVFGTPPEPVPGTVPDLVDWLQRFDFDTAAERARRPAPPFDESADAALSPPDALAPRLAGFAARGGRLLIYHGTADPAFSLHATLRYTEQLQHQWGPPQAQQLLRSFAVPGMGHCQGGPATDRFDALGALVDWVEQGRAPDRLEAGLNPRNPDLPADWPQHRRRPLCPWPQVPRYAGGDAEAAASFRCVAP